MLLEVPSNPKPFHDSLISPSLLLPGPWALWTCSVCCYFPPSSVTLCKAPAHSCNSPRRNSQTSPSEAAIATPAIWQSRRDNRGDGCVTIRDLTPATLRSSTPKKHQKLCKPQQTFQLLPFHTSQQLCRLGSAPSLLPKIPFYLLLLAGAAMARAGTPGVTATLPAFTAVQ